MMATGFLSALSQQALAVLPYLDPSIGWDDRVADLVGRLSLHEKASQMHEATEPVNMSSPNNTLGSDLDQYVFWTECNSGVGGGYPQNINMAATFNRSVVFAAGRGAGSMLRADNNARTNPQNKLSCWSPMMNIYRHPLWGRNHEGYGEDPYLSGELPFANVRGLQGHGLPGYPHHSLAATGCKHFSAFDGPLNNGDAVISDEDWFWNYMPNFEQCVNAGSYSLMCTYAERHDTASNFTSYGCQNHRALTTVLRETWSSKEEGVPGVAKGFVVSDCAYAIHDGPGAMRAGTDVTCQGGYKNADQWVSQGKLNESDLDNALSRSLYVRMRLGEFDPPSANPFRNASVYNRQALTPALEKLSEEAAQQSLVLLKNTDAMLPLSVPTVAHVAVIGLENQQFGNYNTADGNYNSVDRPR